MSNDFDSTDSTPRTTAYATSIAQTVADKSKSSLAVVLPIILDVIKVVLPQLVNCLGQDPSKTTILGEIGSRMIVTNEVKKSMRARNLKPAANRDMMSASVDEILTRAHQEPEADLRACALELTA